MASCPCHPDIEQAIAAHQQIVTTQAEHLGCRPWRDGWDDLISDGMLALWKALTAYDPARGGLDQFLSLRVRFRMIDGLRQRETRGQRIRFFSYDPGGKEGPYNNYREVNSHIVDSFHNAMVSEDDLDSDVHVGDLVARTRELDPRLPRILELLLEGYTQAEAGADVGLSRTRIWQLIQAARQAA